MKVLIFNIYDTNIIMSLFYNLFSLFNHDNLVFFFHYGGDGSFDVKSTEVNTEKGLKIKYLRKKDNLL